MRTRRSKRAGRGPAGARPRKGCFTWYGVATTSAASSETASSLRVRSRIRPRWPGMVTVWVCWLCASALEASALHALHPGRATDRETEQQQEAGEEEADAPLDHGVGTAAEGRRDRRDRRGRATALARRQLARGEPLGRFGRVARRLVGGMRSTRARGRSCRGSPPPPGCADPRRPSSASCAAQDRDLALQGVGLPAGLARGRVEAEREDVQGDDPHQQRGQQRRSRAGPGSAGGRARTPRGPIPRPAVRPTATGHEPRGHRRARPAFDARGRGPARAGLGPPGVVARLDPGTRATRRRRGGGGAGRGCRGNRHQVVPASPPAPRIPGQLSRRAQAGGAASAGCARSPRGWPPGPAG